MATQLEENYLSQFLNPNKTIFEFGPGNCDWARKNPQQEFVGVDLYPFSTHSNLEKPKNMDYICGNLLDEDYVNKELNNRKFDVITCLSSFEHAGIEQEHFEKQHPNINEDQEIIKKFESILKENGTLALTLPGGKNNIYIVDKDGKSHLYKNGEYIKNMRWGFKTFTLNGILNVFFGFNFKLIPEYTKAYLRKPDSDYFETNSWEKVDVDKLNTTDYLEQNGLLCVAFKKQ